MWDADWIEGDRITDPEVARSLRYRRVMVGVDPSGGATECGIVVAALIVGCPCRNGAPQPHFAVLGDYTTKPGTSPLAWADRAGVAYDTHEADRAVAEKNFGGDMVESNLQTARPDITFESVSASRGKTIRAEPIAALAEAHRIHHVGTFEKLEGELTSWTQDESWSPNRLDAMVWALSKLKERAHHGGLKVSTQSGMLSDRVG